MEERPIAQGTGTNVVVNVYLDRLELRTGWQNENVTSLGLKQVVSVSVRGFVNSTLVVELNDGRRLNIGRMAPPDARKIKAGIESQKEKASLYE
ncbi:MAG: hypothetical protein M3283_09435 [Actinomycetota bacterium]|nr:hypothetical protein [Actinomycetota bacterium]